MQPEELVPVTSDDSWVLNLAWLERMAIRQGQRPPYGEWRYVRRREPGDIYQW